MSRPAEVLFEADARVEQMFYLPSIGAHEEQTREFSDFCEDMPEREDASIYKSLPQLWAFASAEDGPEVWMVADALRSTPGFLFMGATPYRQYMSGGSFYSGWGHYYTEWLYAASEAEIAPVLAAWADAMHQADEAKGAA